MASEEPVISLRMHRPLFGRGKEIRQSCAIDCSVHLGLADAADRRQLGDLLGMRGDLHEIAPGPARLTTPEAKKLARRAFLTARFLALGEERLEVGAMDKNRPAIVDRPKALLRPVPDGVTVETKELSDLVRIVQTRLFDQVDPIPPSSRGLPLGSTHRGLPAASRRDAVGDPTVDLPFDPGNTAF